MAVNLFLLISPYEIQKKSLILRYTILLFFRGLMIFNEREIEGEKNADA